MIWLDVDTRLREMSNGKVSLDDFAKSFFSVNDGSYVTSTGLAGGDHLHFTMLLGGNPVTPIDWWSGKWVQDRILRKLQEASQDRLAMLRTWD